MDKTAYLRRIDVDGPMAPTVETLGVLTSAHLRTVPFENLDIHLGREIVLDEAALFDKVVGRRRGGFCYELNGLFARLLQDFGFRVDLLGARMPQEGGYGPESERLALLVRPPDDASRWLVDVGAGRSSPPLPLPLTPAPTEHVDPTGAAFRVTGSDDAWRLERRLLGDEWNEVYAFTLRPHALDDFRAMCHHHQTSPESPFPRKRICTQLTAHGRVTLSDLRLITATGDRREERDLPGEEAFRAVLREQFGIDLDA